MEFKRMGTVFGLVCGLASLWIGEAWGMQHYLVVPRHGQETNTWCWAACDQMVRHFHEGAGGDQCGIVNFGLKRNDCCPSPGSASCQQGHNSTLIEAGSGYQAQVHWGALSFAAIKDEISVAQRPLIYTLQFNGGGQHQRVIWGVYDNSGQWFVVYDPLPKKNLSTGNSGGTSLWVTYANWSSSVVATYYDIHR